MERSGVAAHEQPAALDERPKLGQIELPEIDDAFGGGGAQCLSGGGGNP